MSTYPTKILLATDGATDDSEDAALAVRTYVDLSSSTGSELHILHAWHTVPLYVHPSLEGVFDPSPHERRARELLKTEVERIKKIGGALGGKLLRMRPPADEIIEFSEELEAGLIVMGSRGLGPVECLNMGSVSEEVVHYAKCPVLVVRGGKGAWPPARVVVGEDSSREAKEAVELAASIGRLFDAHGYVDHAYPTLSRISEGEDAFDARIVEEALQQAEKALEERTERLEGTLGCPPEVKVAVGDAAALILGVAQEGEPALIAVGSRGHGTVKRMRRGYARLGSVSIKVIRAAHGPVLVCSRRRTRRLTNGHPRAKRLGDAPREQDRQSRLESYCTSSSRKYWHPLGANARSGIGACRSTVSAT